MGWTQPSLFKTASSWARMVVNHHQEERGRVRKWILQRWESTWQRMCSEFTGGQHSAGDPFQCDATLTREWRPFGEVRAPEIGGKARLFNGAKSTLAMLPETHLVWNVLRAIGGIRNALLEVRS
jgi:hypothetical protein